MQSVVCLTDCKLSVTRQGIVTLHGCLMNFTVMVCDTTTKGYTGTTSAQQEVLDPKCCVPSRCMVTRVLPVASCHPACSHLHCGSTPRGHDIDHPVRGHAVADQVIRIPDAPKPLGHVSPGPVEHHPACADKCDLCSKALWETGSGKRVCLGGWGVGGWVVECPHVCVYIHPGTWIIDMQEPHWAVNHDAPHHVGVTDFKCDAVHAASLPNPFSLEYGQFWSAQACRRGSQSTMFWITASTIWRGTCPFWIPALIGDPSPLKATTRITVLRLFCATHSSV